MKVSEINIYPVKSLKRIDINEAVVTKRGLAFDRRWLVTDRDGRFITQREFPKMAVISTEITRNKLRFSANEDGSLDVVQRPENARRQHVTIWSSVCEAEVYSDDVNEWFSKVLGTECQLVFMPERTERPMNPIFDQGGEIVSFADGYPLMVLGEASLNDLNSRLADPVPMNRFRPNIVISGSEPYAENRWKRVRIGDVTFRSTKPCARCVMTTVDQKRGDFNGKEPLRTLAGYRKAREVVPEHYEAFGMGANDVCFGQNLVPENPGKTISFGDEVEVLELI